MAETLGLHRRHYLLAGSTEESFRRATVITKYSEEPNSAEWEHIRDVLGEERQKHLVDLSRLGGSGDV